MKGSSSPVDAVVEEGCFWFLAAVRHRRPALSHYSSREDRRRREMRQGGLGGGRMAATAAEVAGRGRIVMLEQR